MSKHSPNHVLLLDHSPIYATPPLHSPGPLYAIHDAYNKGISTQTLTIGLTFGQIIAILEDDPPNHPTSSMNILPVLITRTLSDIRKEYGNHQDARLDERVQPLQ
ncbi:hypothetical protein Pcinc_000109 [Petrolisthes cinctipes]|uniref:Uncharacterized protein n=1 Tax=Petrolisthes cinctipes TaxID=88211 RepID=A0AAE1GP37_PETCI|nr:hypothetical protein Pcinc_000109 [Petrolisthes cinctipes]